MAYSVLLVDDSPTMQRVIQITLSGEEIQLTCVKTAQEALKLGQTQRFDVAIIDIGLPDQNGYTLTKNFLKEPFNQKTPVMLLSSRQNPLDMSLLQTSGAKDSFYKPFEISEFIGRIKVLLSINRPSPTSNPPTAATPAVRLETAPAAEAASTPKAIASEALPNTPEPTAAKIQIIQAPPPPVATMASAVTQISTQVLQSSGSIDPEALKIYQQTIEKIAWEVIPKIAESILQEQLHNKK